MKYLLALLIIPLNTLSFAQAFHFNDVQTILYKTTDESPAHWYLEIFSDVPVDTTLRWKAVYGPTLPTEWHFTFDDQNTFHNPVHDGDSADFTLYANPILPQKLIIGAMLNGTIGNGSIYFEIYDPSDLSTMVTIEYRFIVSQGTASLSDLNSDENWFFQNHRTITVNDELIGAQLEILDASGKRVYRTNIHENVLLLPDFCKNGIFYLHVQLNNIVYSSRILLF